jgi:esterase/lipase
MFEHTFRNGHTTKCEYIKPDSNKTQKLTVVYTHGFCSDPYGRKPEEVKKWCVEHGIGFFRWEIAGHGSDKPRFEETTIDTYREQIYEIVNDIVEEDIIIGGASLGGWLSLLGAIKYPNKVKGLFGLAAAPDFLKRYIEAYFGPKEKEYLEKYGKVEFPTGDFTYVITKDMIESGYRNMLLDKDVIPFDGKVRLIQGMNDKSLEWKVAPIIASKLTSNDVKVVLLKESNHRLSSDEDVIEIHKALSELCL